MSSIGLIPCQDTKYNTRDSYYLKKGDPITGPLASPVDILSADLSNTVSITAEDAGAAEINIPSGNLTLTSGEDAAETGLALNNNNGYSYKMTNSNVSEGGLNENAFQIYAYGPTISPTPILSIAPSGDVAISTGDLNIVSGGINALAGDINTNNITGRDIKVIGDDGPGIVYDTVYNTLPAQNVSSNFGNYLTEQGQQSVRTGAFDTIPTPNVFENISGSFTFPIIKSGRYMLQIALAAGSGSSALDLNGADPATGVKFYLQDSSQAPPVFVPYGELNISYAQVQAVPDSENLFANLMVGLTEGQEISMMYSKAGAPTGGVVKVELIQMC